MQKKLRVLVLAAAALACIASPFSARAVYNANMSGIITDVLVYPDSPWVLIKLQNQPTSHPACNAQYFAFGGDAPPENKRFMYARALMALSQGTAVAIGYDASGDCASSYIRVHRIG